MFKKIGLQIKITGVIIVALFIMITFMNIFNSLTVRDLTEKLATETFTETAKLETLKVSSFFDDSYNILNAISSGIEGVIKYTNNNLVENILYSSIKNAPTYIDSLSVILNQNMLGNEYLNVQYARNINGNITRKQLVEKEMYLEHYTNVITKSSAYLSYIKSENNGLKTILSYPLIENNKTIGVLTAELSQDYIKNILNNTNSLKNSTLYLLDNEGMIISSSEKTNIGKNITSIYDKKEYAQKIIGSDSVIYSDKTSLNIVMPIKLNEGQYWQVLIVIPMSILLKESIIVRLSVIAFGAVIILALSIIIFFIIKFMVTKKISDITKYIQNLSNGDISWTISNKLLKRNDEWGNMAYNFEATLKKLNDIVGIVKDSAYNVKSAATEVAQGNNDLSHRTESQAASLEETASSMEEMASAIKSSTSNSIDGNKMMIESKSSIDEAVDIVIVTTKNIEEVFEASSKITHITKIIENIAFQTNILALNAAVEAARAGEQGRGFAVVASEVRNLAQTSQTSARDITKLISESNDKIKRATETARKSEEIFNNLKTQIEETAKIMQDISSMALEQQSGVDQVNKAVSEMDMATQQNAALVEESTAASQSLLSQSEDLVKVMEFFKLKNENN